MFWQEDFTALAAKVSVECFPKEGRRLGIVATNKGQPCVLLPESRAGRSYRDMARRMLGEAVPLRLSAEPRGILGILHKLIGAS